MKRRGKNQMRNERLDLQMFVGFQAPQIEQPEIQHQVRKKPTYTNILETQKRQKMYMKSKFQFITDAKVIETTDILPWTDVKQVIFPTTSDINCPICMNDQSQLVAPQITVCGHIYCLYCYLHHSTVCIIAKQDLANTKNRCPFCNEYIQEEDLRSVSVQRLRSTTKGCQVQLKQLLRHKGSTKVYDVETLTETPQFARVIRVNQSYLANVYQGELEELTRFLFECESSQETSTIPYVHRAISIVGARLQALTNTSEEPKQFFTKMNNNNQELQSLYQQSQGLLEFLHPICNKYIMKLPQLPVILESQVIEIDQIVISDSNRNRYKFLSHLPLYSELKFLEIEMYDILEKADYNDFYDEMEVYRKKQAEKQREQQQTKRKSSTNYQKPSPITRVQSQPVGSTDILQLEQFPELPQVPQQIQRVESEQLPTYWETKLAPTVKEPVVEEIVEKEKEIILQQVFNKKGKKKKVILIPTGFQ